MLDRVGVEEHGNRVIVVTVNCLIDAVKKCDMFLQGENETISIHAHLFILTCTRACVACCGWQVGSWEKADRV